MDNLRSHFCENDKILKEKEAELDNFVHQPPRGGANAPEFEPFDKITQIEIGNEKVEPEIGKTGNINKELKFKGGEELNTNIKSKSKIKNEPITTTKTKRKATSPAIQKFSKHIKFIDYIPTHEIITYRHLFAYGFYVE